MIHKTKPKVLEFFAGGGFARLGLSADFEVVWANDIDPMKASAWSRNFGAAGFELGDVAEIDVARVPKAELAWASFPCQDLSLAGTRAGLSAARSGTFYRFIEIISGLKILGNAPKVLVIENVSGLLTSHSGRDFAALMQTLAELGYQAGALEIDARFFLPQSRPRVFIIACALGHAIPEVLKSDGPSTSLFHSSATQKVVAHLPSDLRANHIWWALPVPPAHQQTLGDIVDSSDQNWWTQAKTLALIHALSTRHKEKLEAAQKDQQPKIGAVYRRTRIIDGVRRAVGEVRFDGLAGCLRTPSGGSSRQFLLFVDGSQVRARALNAREAMRLMGVSDEYDLPQSVLSGLKIAGDGVAVPVVAWLSKHLLAPLTTAMS